MLHVLIVEDDRETADLLAELAQSEACEASVAASIRHASTHGGLRQPDLVFISDTFTDGSHGEALDAVPGRHAGAASAERIVISADPSPAAVVQAFRCGAADVLIKPIDCAYVRQLLRTRQMKLAEKTARNDKKQAPGASGTERFAAAPVLLGESTVMATLRHQIACVAPTEASVLLLGESGSGKELVAQSIHALSERRRQSFLPVNCGAISPHLIESEIFGHERGSFTGADRQHKGYFERASAGTLFLDEIIEMPVELQVKLLRVLETGSFMRIGSNQELQTDVRIIAATNRDPEQAIAAGRFRLDLYHRLNVFPLRVPALRERDTDAELIALCFLAELNAAQETHKRMSASMLASLRHHDWPGNVRELRNFIHRAYILADDVLDAYAPDLGRTSSAATALMLTMPVGTSLADMDRQLIFATLDLCGGVKKHAADLLGISLKTLYNRLEEYGGKSKHLTLVETGKTAKAALRMPGHESGLLN